MMCENIILVMEMVKNIEDAVFDELLPLNSLVVLQRLQELLKENKTNNIKQAMEKDVRVKRAMWLLMAQGFGSLANIDLWDFYDELE